MALFTNSSTFFVEYTNETRFLKKDSIVSINISDNETISLRFKDETVLAITKSEWIIHHATKDLVIAEINEKFTQGVIPISDTSKYTQGYYALQSPIHFGGVATNGKFDFRPIEMVESGTLGHTGDGSLDSPLVFSLEGLTTNGSGSIRASMQFNPDEDEGRLDSRLLFTNHSGYSASTFAIESTSVAMESGANIEYSNSPNIQFFISDSIKTNGTNDAGSVRLQIKSDVAGTVSMSELTFFIQS